MLNKTTYEFEEWDDNGVRKYRVIKAEIIQHLWYESKKKAIEVYETCLRLGEGAVFREIV